MIYLAVLVYINQLYQVEHKILSNRNLNIICLKNMNATYQKECVLKEIKNKTHSK